MTAANGIDTFSVQMGLGYLFTPIAYVIGVAALILVLVVLALVPLFAQSMNNTLAGREVLDDASGVVDDTMKAVLKRTPQVARHADAMTELLEDIGR